MHPADNERFMQVLALADDLTGALEVGAKFAARGMAAIVSNTSDLPPDAPVVVINTESRHLTAEEAGFAVSAVTATKAHIIYKKTDSTLRGNIRSEMQALARLYPEARIAYVPAYPAMNRTVRGGHLFVNGTRVNETAFACDPLNPVTESSVARVVGDDLDCTIFDGETTEDVARAAAAILQDPRYRILAGPAAFAEAIAAILAGSPQATARWPVVRSALSSTAACMSGRRSRSNARWRPEQPALTRRQAGASCQQMQAPVLRLRSRTRPGRWFATSLQRHPSMPCLYSAAIRLPPC